MNQNSKKFILRQLYDIRPLRRDGSLDLEKINNLKPIAEINADNFIRRHEELLSEKKENSLEIQNDYTPNDTANIVNLEESVPIKNIRIVNSINEVEKNTETKPIPVYPADEIAKFEIESIPDEKIEEENITETKNVLAEEEAGLLEVPVGYLSETKLEPSQIEDLSEDVISEISPPVSETELGNKMIAESPLGIVLSDDEENRFKRRKRRARRTSISGPDQKGLKKFKSESNVQPSFQNSLDYFKKMFAKVELAKNQKNYLDNVELFTIKKFFSAIYVRTKYFFPEPASILSIINGKKARKKRKQAIFRNTIWKDHFYAFASIGTAIFAVVFSIGYINQGIKIKQESMFEAQKAYADLIDGKNSILNKDYDSASLSFNDAYEKLDALSKDFSRLGTVVVESSRYIPYLSKISTGQYLSNAGKNISQIGIKITELLELYDKAKNPSGQEGNIPYLEIFKRSEENIQSVASLSKEIEMDLNKVNVDDIPEAQRREIIEMKQKLPEFNNFFGSFLENDHIFTEILGGNGPRKYLVLFQNNQEMRATGGFIGTYAIIDISNGRVRKFFVDGIFNPDGQLREKVVPPIPIQKISAAWSLHDSNWFPDFPVSAEKASWFYEKTGGPTVDGVIAITPEVLHKLLEVTGPIEMPEYNVTVDKDNFASTIQYEVEFNYDKEENQPKKILSDLAPIVLDKIFNSQTISDSVRTMKMLTESLDEKHILIYSKNYGIEKMLSEKGWTGEVLKTQKDYLSVINTNINGFKTDGVIDESIEHQAEIQKDGSIIDTVKIVRKHNGGDSEYEFWNKVNADYMRVYVPKGSKLIEVQGQTREYNTPPLDYDTLHFKRDPQIETEEQSMLYDENTGTRIYEDTDKTVFANWAYVTPKETVEITYKYVLPFRINFGDGSNFQEVYSLLVQKQSGSKGSQFSSEIILPQDVNLIWKFPDDIEKKSNSLKYETDLKTDKFWGIAFEKK
jgi:hypothetical protein